MRQHIAILKDTTTIDAIKTAAMVREKIRGNIMFKELKNSQDHISNTHIEWVDLKVNGVVNKEAVAEAEKIE